MGWWGVIKRSFQNILRQGVGKGKSCSYGEGVLTPAPGKILITHKISSVIFGRMKHLVTWLDKQYLKLG